MRLSAQQRAELDELLAPYANDEAVRSMDGFIQHGTISTLDHCRSVAEVSYWLDAHLPGSADKATLAAGAFLHDFFLYDWHGAGWRHSYRHAGIAARNAVEHFGVGPRVEHVIASHMWPISPLRPPRTREALLVTVADKYVSAGETLFGRKRKWRPCT